ncbi:hypothetical protein [Shewanella baltica]|uniref:hypothetical protein n=1 Tax=Shewanella baltica TaxID=62322 RepID=UPI003D79677E
MDSLIPYLPTIVTALIIAPLGFYVKQRLKALATREDFDSAIEQLRRSTKAVESIKSQLNEKYWVKQQMWETKRGAYEELITSLNYTKKYLDSLVAYFENYVDCFVNIGGSSGTLYETPESEECENSYIEYIEGEQKKFNETYDSAESHKMRQDLLNETNDSFIRLDSIFAITSIYLHSDLASIQQDIETLKDKIFNDQLRQEEYESKYEFFERILEHYLISKESLRCLIENAKALAIKDLRLEFDDVSA